MDKQVVTNDEITKKEKPTLEGYLFYFLLFAVIILLPLGSAIWLLSVA